jgi:hypothetical protein
MVHVEPQVTSYKYNLYKGYKTREGAEKSYSEFLSQHCRNYVGPKIVANGGGIWLKDFIIAVLVIWIMYLLFL